MAKTLFDIREEAELMEKLRASDPTGKWISDFVHSDNPKFAGKSKKERIRMALGASYGAKKEEVELDEAIKLNSKVVIHAPGKSYHGKVGHVGEIRNGAFKGAPKTYTIDHDGGSIQLDKKNVKLYSEETEIDESAWGNDKLANLQAAHARHSEKAIQANKVGDHEAVKVHMSKMNSIKNQMNKIKQNEDVNLDESKHRVSVTVSQPDHTMVTKRKEQQQKFVRVSGDREGAVARAQQHFKKQGYRVHGAEYVGAVNENLDLDEAGGMKSAALVKAMQRKQKHTAAMSPEKQQKQRQEYQDKKQQNEMSNVVFDNSGDMQGVTAGSIKSGAGAKPAHLIKPEKDAAARARSLKHKEKKMKTEAKSLYDRHQELRKKSGLPDPSHYLKLAKQKQAEIDALKADQGSTERLHTAAPEPHPGAQKTFTALRNKA